MGEAVTSKTGYEKSFHREQGAVVLCLTVDITLLLVPGSLGSYLFSLEGPLGNLARGSQEISDLCSSLTFIFENFQIFFSYFRIYWENWERSVFSYKKEDGLFSNNSLFYEISSIRVAQISWVLECIIYLSQNWKLSICCVIYKKKRMMSNLSSCKTNDHLSSI